MKLDRRRSRSRSSLCHVAVRNPANEDQVTLFLFIFPEAYREYGVRDRMSDPSGRFGFGAASNASKIDASGGIISAFARFIVRQSSDRCRGRWNINDGNLERGFVLGSFFQELSALRPSAVRHVYRPGVNNSILTRTLL